MKVSLAQISLRPSRCGLNSGLVYGEMNNTLSSCHNAKPVDLSSHVSEPPSQRCGQNV
jgi:hypothetical protein